MAPGAVCPGSDAAVLPCRWAWVLQDALGIAFCLYMLKTIRLPTFKVRAAGPGAVRGRGLRAFSVSAPCSEWPGLPATQLRPGFPL